MYAFGFSINNMTLLALTLSVGFVVDDAIVMLENIVRHIEGGMRPFEAALKGAREIGFTIISITFSLIAVFIPVLLMGGMVGPRVPRVRGDDRGRHRDFGLRVADAHADAVRARAARPSRRRTEAELHPARVRARLPGLAAGLRMGARPGARPTRSIMLLVTFATMVGTVWLYIVIPKGFFPTEDTGFISAITEAQTDISFDAMVERQRKVAEIIRADTAVDYVNSTVGVGGPNSDRQSGPHARRAQAEGGARTTCDRGHPAAAPGDQPASPAWPSSSRRSRTSTSAAAITKSQYQYTLQSSDTDALYRLAPEMRDKIAKLAGAARRQHRPLHQEPADEGRGRPRKGGGLRHHHRPGAAGAVQRLRHAPGGDDLHRRPTTTRSSWRAKPEFQTDPSSLSKHLRQDHRAERPRRNVGRPGLGRHRKRHSVRAIDPALRGDQARADVGPLLVNHQGQQPAVTISFNLAPGLFARPGGRRDPEDRARIRTCRRRSRPASRAPRRCSRNR